MKALVVSITLLLAAGCETMPVSNGGDSSGGSVQAEESESAIIEEKWKCFSIYDDRKKNVLIELERYKPWSEVLGIEPDDPLMIFGTVTAAGTTNSARFSVEGLGRRWSWDLGDDDTYDYALVIKPDGTGIYYDFTLLEDGENTTGGSQVYDCVMSKP